MKVQGRRRAHDAERAPRGYGWAVVAVGLGIAVANGHGVAWADPGQAATSNGPTSHSTSATDNGPKEPVGGHRKRQLGSSTASETGSGPGGETTSGKKSTTGVDSPSTGSSPSARPDSAAPKQDSPTPTVGGPSLTDEPADTPRNRRAARFATSSDPVATSPLARTASRPESRFAAALSPASRRPNLTAAAAPAARATATTTAPSALVAPAATPTAGSTTPGTTTPSPPGPLSPIAEIAAAPGRIVNGVLQVLDITTSADGPQSPIDFDPIDEALFATFRRLEEAVGLYKTPTVQPVLLNQTYTGPTTGLTPTVTQFLNAAAGEYVLGGAPGGLEPFTVDGKQMTSTNILSGESAKVWVTPQKQIIIAYQGTTGGTNLLFNPLIAVSQLLTDAQIIFTNTTPQAFTDALAFEQEVEAAAAEQGYGKSDIFVTGHSLGGWEAQYVAQQTGLGGIGFESPGINTTVPGNGIESGFVNVETYGDPAAYLATDLPGLQPFMPPYVPGGGSKPHYGSIIMIGDPNETIPLINASSLWGPNLIGDAVFAVVFLGNFFEHHLPGVQAYNLGVTPDPGVVPWLGAAIGPVHAGWGDLTIPQLKKAASDAGVLITP